MFLILILMQVSWKVPIIKICKEFNPSKDKGAISIIGFDLGLPLLNSSFADITLYADYSKIVDFGSGIATGVMFDFNLSSMLYD